MLATLVVHTLVGRASRAWRTLYLLVPLLLTIASWLLGKEWFGTSRFFITSAVLAPLGLLMARRTLPNGPFVRQTLGYIRAAVVGGIFALTAMLSAMAIYHSVIYIFNIPASWEVRNLVDSYIVLFSWALLWPLTALARLDGYLSDEPQGTKTTDTALNWILAPALLVYAAILYLYCLQILFTWSLPKGGVAYLVFGFTMALFTVKALQELVVRRRYDWFFRPHQHLRAAAARALLGRRHAARRRLRSDRLARLPHRLRRDHDRSRRTLRRTPHRTLLLHRRNGLRPLLPDGLHSPLLGHGVLAAVADRAPSGWPAKRGCSTNPADSICPASTNATRRSSNVIASSTPRSTTSTTTIRCCWPTASASPAPANSSAASIATGSETISRWGYELDTAEAAALTSSYSNSELRAPLRIDGYRYCYAPVSFSYNNGSSRYTTSGDTLRLYLPDGRELFRRSFDELFTERCDQLLYWPDDEPLYTADNLLFYRTDSLLISFSWAEVSRGKHRYVALNVDKFYTK